MSKSTPRQPEMESSVRKTTRKKQAKGSKSGQQGETLAPLYFSECSPAWRKFYQELAQRV